MAPKAIARPPAVRVSPARLRQRAELGALYVLLASPESSYATGQVLGRRGRGQP